jgi:hypothetical protein
MRRLKVLVKEKGKGGKEKHKWSLCFRTVLKLLGTSLPPTETQSRTHSQTHFHLHPFTVSLKRCVVQETTWWAANSNKQKTKIPKNCNWSKSSERSSRQCVKYNHYHILPSHPAMPHNSTERKTGSFLMSPSVGNIILTRTADFHFQLYYSMYFCGSVYSDKRKCCAKTLSLKYFYHSHSWIDKFGAHHACNGETALYPLASSSTWQRAAGTQLEARSKLVARHYFGPHVVLNVKPQFGKW